MRIYDRRRIKTKERTRKDAPLLLLLCLPLCLRCKDTANGGICQMHRHKIACCAQWSRRLCPRSVLRPVVPCRPQHRRANLSEILTGCPPRRIHPPYAQRGCANTAFQNLNGKMYGQRKRRGKIRAFVRYSGRCLSDCFGLSPPPLYFRLYMIWCT